MEDNLYIFEALKITEEVLKMPIPLIAPAIVTAAVAAKGAVITPGVVTAGIGVFGALGKQFIAKQAAAQGARVVLGATIAPWVGGVLLAGTILYGGYKIIRHLTQEGFEMEAELNLKEFEVKFKNKKITQKEFAQITSNAEFMGGIKEALQKYQKEKHLTSHELYDELMKQFKSMDNFKDIPDEQVANYVTKLTC